MPWRGFLFDAVIGSRLSIFERYDDLHFDSVRYVSDGVRLSDLPERPRKAWSKVGPVAVVHRCGRAILLNPQGAGFPVAPGLMLPIPLLPLVKRQHSIRQRHKADAANGFNQHRLQQ